MYGAYTIQGERHFHGDWTWAPRSWNNTSGRYPCNVTNAHSLELCLLRNWHKSDGEAGRERVAFDGGTVCFYFLFLRQKKIFLFLILESSSTHTHTHTHTNVKQSHKATRSSTLHTNKTFEFKASCRALTFMAFLFLIPNYISDNNYILRLRYWWYHNYK